MVLNVHRNHRVIRDGKLSEPAWEQQIHSVVMGSVRGQELCECRGGRPGLLVHNSPYGLRGRKATLNLNKDLRAQKLCESRGGHSGLPVLNRPYGLCGR